MDLLEEACKKKLLSKWPDCRFIESKVNSVSSIDFVIELADGGVGVVRRKSQKSAGNASTNLQWRPASIKPETYEAILRAIKLNHPLFHATYKTSRLYAEKTKKKLVGFDVTLARTTAKLKWEDMFPEDPVPADVQWTVVGQSAKKQGKYLVVVHTLKDGKSKQINEYKIEIERISKAIYDSTLTFNTFPFNIPHSHKITEKNSVTYDRSIAEWEQHAEEKGRLEDSKVQGKLCSNCGVSFFDTSSHELCYSCCVAEQRVSRDKAIKLCKQAEKLARQTDWQQTADLIKQLQLEWQQLVPLSRDDSEKLWKRFQSATQRFFDARSKFFDQQDKLRMANKKKAERLIAKANKVAGSTDWKKTGETIKSLQQEWKAVNPLPRDDAEKLWQQFQTVTQTFFDRREASFDSMDQQRNENRRKAQEMIAAAQRWLDADDSKRAAEEIKKLQKQWKSVNPLPREDADKLWHKFQSTCQEFFDRRAALHNKKYNKKYSKKNRS
jgi:hypothetical protein